MKKITRKSRFYNRIIETTPAIIYRPYPKRAQRWHSFKTAVRELGRGAAIVATITAVACSTIISDLVQGIAQAGIPAMGVA